MSRTDKTKPLHIKLAHRDLDWEEVHDHTKGPCDLAPATDLDSYGWTSLSGRRCYRSFVYTGTHVCCCHLCHSADSYEVRPGKRQRLNGKRAARKWEREYDESWDNPDMWVSSAGPCDDSWYEEATA